MHVVVERGKTTLFEDMPSKSIALDGFVQGPQLDPRAERFSFDHHDKCVRLVTSATCKQVFVALALGFDPTGYAVYVNDVDEDTILSVWLLENRHRIADRRVEWLVDRMSDVDAHGPAYPVRDTEDHLFRRFVEGVNAPIRRHRKAGTLQTTDLTALLRECVDLVSGIVDEQDPVVPEQPQRSYRVVRKGAGGWVLVESADKVADLLYATGHPKAIVYNQQLDGSYNYTVMVQSDLVDGFRVGPGSACGSILHRLAEIELGWGGGSTIGGSPRQANGRRSELTPDQVFEIVETLLG